MRVLIPMIALLLVMALPLKAAAVEFTAPEVPESAAEQMPRDRNTFGEGLMELLQNTLLALRPDLRDALRTGSTVIAAVMMVSLLRTFSGSVASVAEMAGAVSIAGILLFSSRSMVTLGAETIQEMSDYGKLLLPVLTAALAAQGGVAASTALYAGTAAFDTVLTGMISDLLLPGIFLYLALAAANSAMGEEILKKAKELLKSAISWFLKILLTIFTTYMSVTGVVSGTTDAAALKATKVTISSVVPVVGSILSDASEAVLVSAGVAKSAAGVYGILAVLAVFLLPFTKIGIQYLVLKAVAAICAMFAPKTITGLVEDFSSAMGLLLGMTGSVCLLLLISTVCFMKGIGS